MAGRKNFVVVVPDMSFSFSNPEMIDQAVQSLYTNLCTIKETYGFDCTFHIIKLTHNFIDTTESPLIQSSMTV